MKEDSIGKHGLSIELFSVLLWSNVGFVAVYLMLFAVDWLFVNWVSPDAGQVHIAWSKLLFMLIAANLIIYFAFTSWYNGSSGKSADEQDR